jgi:hypothetical protein
MNNIRTLTFNGIVKAKTIKRWVPLDDEIFDKLSVLLSNELKIKISDFLNLFYYFIICYSKTCFKKNANWYNKRKLSNQGILFNYDIANENDCHAKLLAIQSKMYIFRKEYQSKLNRKETYFTENKINEIKDFITPTEKKIENYL